MGAQAKKASVSAPKATPSDSRAVIKAGAANELFFGVVGPVGAGSSHVARQLSRCLKEAKLGSTPFTCHILKASEVIRESYGSEENWKAELDHLSPLDKKVAMQEKGDFLRLQDHSAIAAAVVGKITKARADAQGIALVADRPVEPDGKPRAYIIDSLKHPAEVKLLRRLYGDSFVLIGVVCSAPELERRLSNALFTGTERNRPKNQAELKKFILRDADDPDHKNGQHVASAFHESDFFVDNTIEVRPPESGEFKDAIDERIIGELSRLVSIILHDKIHRPSTDESAMHVAFSAQLQSSCLSRQVGAALVDKRGHIIATGTNEVPKAGGGVYGEEMVPGGVENRCAFCNNGERGPFCSNNSQQNSLIREVITALFGEQLSQKEHDEKLLLVRKTPLGGLLEFSRSVHAEMDALLSAGRSGASTIGSRLFVTTYPCHYCARHIVSAGVYEVQYIEPYPKSRALDLHGDAIESVPEKWISPGLDLIHNQSRGSFGQTGSSALVEGAKSAAEKARLSIDVGRSTEKNGKVLFRPFVGVAPRLYTRVFLKDRDYKNKVSGEFLLAEADWGNSWSTHKVSYATLELEVIRQVPQGG